MALLTPALMLTLTIRLCCALVYRTARSGQGESIMLSLFSTLTWSHGGLLCPYRTAAYFLAAALLLLGRTWQQATSQACRRA